LKIIAQIVAIVILIRYLVIVGEDRPCQFNLNITTMSYLQNQEWVIWGITYDGKLINTIRECKKPALTKDYKELGNRFNAIDEDIQQFGYMTLTELRKQDNWINFETKATV
jgi:hypothetical protein